MSIHLLDTSSLPASSSRAHERGVDPAVTRPAVQAASTQRAERPADAGQVRKELAATLERISAKDTRLSFEVDDASGNTVIFVRDGATSEVIRQIPSEEMLQVARRLEAHLSDSGEGAGVLLADEA